MNRIIAMIPSNLISNQLVRILAECPRVIHKLVIDYIHPEFVNLLEEVVPHFKSLLNACLIQHPDYDFEDFYLLQSALPCESERIGRLLSMLISMDSKCMYFRYNHTHCVIEALSGSKDAAYNLHKYLYNLDLMKIMTKLKLGWIQLNENQWHRSEINHRESDLWELLFKPYFMMDININCQLHSSCIMITKI